MSEDKLKISLTRQDLENLELSYSEMDYSNAKTREALLLLLEKAKLEVGFSPRGARLFIEIYRSDGGGCVIYFTGIKRSRFSGGAGAMSPVVFEFEGAEELIEGACKTFLRYSHRIYKSSLYLLNGKYRLLVYNLDYSDKLSIYFLAEFGKKLGDDEIFVSYTIEHGKELIADCALDTLATYFG